MRLLWLTDIHLDHLRGGNSARDFAKSLKQQYDEFDSVVVTGDIATAETQWLFQEFVRELGKDTYFVLGNHDFYRGSFAYVEQVTAALPWPAIWLDNTKLSLLDAETALIGVGGWYDCRAADPYKSELMMSDFVLIEDLKKRMCVPPFDIVPTCQAYAQVAYDRAVVKLNEALTSGAKTIVFATHVPPYKEATWHEGKMSNANFLPWFTNQILGDLLSAYAIANPAVRFLVLCGHSHSPGRFQPHPNLVVLTGQAEYGFPAPAGFFDLPLEDEIWDEAAV